MQRGAVRHRQRQVRVEPSTAVLFCNTHHLAGRRPMADRSCERGIHNKCACGGGGQGRAAGWQAGWCAQIPQSTPVVPPATPTPPQAARLEQGKGRRQQGGHGGPAGPPSTAMALGNTQQRTHAEPPHMPACSTWGGRENAKGWNTYLMHTIIQGSVGLFEVALWGE